LSTFGEGAPRPHLKFRDQKPPKTRRFACSCSRALTVGLVSGNRNVTLAWAAASASLMGQQQVELYLAASVLPIFMLPALTRPAVAWLLRSSRSGSIAPGAAS
jgi:hypothetical protein